MFWLLRYAFVTQVLWASGIFVDEIRLLKDTWSILILACYVVLGEIIFTYIIVYWLIPRFFKSRKGLFIIGLICFSALLFIAEYPVFIDWMHMANLPRYSFPVFWNCLMAITGLSHTVCGLFIAFKLFKNYYIKMEERDTLIRENVQAEMQVLKAQIHPHFLFNTLNNIYSFNLNKSPQTAGLVLKLSDTLKYMTIDCEAELVLLEKELKMVQDYMGLEKVRYGKRLNLEVEVKGNYQDKLIAPLLLIPFVENCFKHGTSEMLDDPWIKMQVTIEEQFLNFKISNSKPKNPAKSNGTNGIGLKNVRRRLQLLYPGEHQLKINTDDHSYRVELRVPLQYLNSLEKTVKERGNRFHRPPLPGADDNPFFRSKVEHSFD